MCPDRNYPCFCVQELAEQQLGQLLKQQPLVALVKPLAVTIPIAVKVSVAAPRKARRHGPLQGQKRKRKKRKKKRKSLCCSFQTFILSSSVPFVTPPFLSFFFSPSFSFSF
jgi:hypothetical protein